MKKNFFNYLACGLAAFMGAFLFVSNCPNIDFLKAQTRKPVTVSAEELRQYTLPGTPGAKTIAIIDSGYHYGNGFDETKIVGQYNAIDGSAEVDDECGHGTAMLTMLLGYNEGNIHITGINPTVNVIVIKVTDSDGRTTAATLAAGINYAVQQSVDVINISMGTAIENTTLCTSIENASAAGIQVVASVGDTNSSQALYPAQYAGEYSDIFAVEAQATDGNVYYRSNIGPDETVRIPGENIDTFGYNLLNDEWGITSISGSSVASMIFASLLTLDNYEIDYDYLYECKEENELVTDLPLPQNILNAEQGDFYAETKDEIDSLSSYDHQMIVQYGNAVSIVNGKFQLDTSVLESDENTQEIIGYISDNINTINALVEEGAAYINATGEVTLACDADVLSQFGFTSFKLRWYGVDASMDTQMLMAVVSVSFLVRLFSKSIANQFKSCQKTMLSSQETNTIVNKILQILDFSTSSGLAFEIGNKAVNKLLSKYGSISNICTSLIDIVTTVFSVAMGIYTAVSVATGGIGTIILTVAGYIINSFAISLLDSAKAILLTVAGTVHTTKMTIRWLRGFGTKLYFA